MTDPEYTSVGDIKVAVMPWVVFIGAICGLVWLFTPDRYWYAWKYGVSSSQIYVSHRPQDCDFLHSPIGTKSCHYEKNVQPQQISGVVVAVDVTWVKHNN